MPKAMNRELRGILVCEFDVWRGKVSVDDATRATVDEEWQIISHLQY